MNRALETYLKLKLKLPQNLVYSILRYKAVSGEESNVGLENLDTARKLIGEYTASRQWPT